MLQSRGVQQIEPQARDPVSPYRPAAGSFTTRRLKKTLRRLDPWSVLKVSVVFNLAVMGVFFLAAVVLFYIAEAAGIVANIEGVIQSVGWDTFQIRAIQVFRFVLVLGMINAIIWTALSVFVSFLYNLVADLVGGVEITTTEREY